MIGYLLAIGAAAIWSAVALSATRIVRYFGSYNYNLLRLLGIIVFFFPYIYINWQSIYFDQSIFTAIVLSSIIGIIIGDTFLFICLKRLGPRRQALLFSMQIPTRWNGSYMNATVYMLMTSSVHKHIIHTGERR